MTQKLCIDDRTLRTSAALGFLLLFPFFAYYHTAVAFNIIPPVFGGLFGPATAAIVLIFFILSYKWLPGITRRDFTFTFSCALFFTFVLFWSIINYGFQIESANIKEAFIQSVTTCLHWAALFFVGHFLAFDSREIYRIALFSMIAALISLIFFAASTGSIMFYAKALAADTESVASYQGFAKSALVTLLFLLAATRKMSSRVLLATGGLFIMFILGARSELLAFFLSLSVLIAWWASFNVRYAALAFLLVLIAPIAAAIGFDYFAQSRHGQLLDLSSASSWIARRQLEELAITQIAANPMLGFFGGHVVEGGSTGSYAHNILSTWVSYGIGGFMLYFLLNAWVAIGASYHVFVRRENHPCAVFAFSLGVSCLVLTLFTKSVFWGLPAIAWGAYAQFLYRKHALRQLSAANVQDTACT